MAGPVRPASRCARVAAAAPAADDNYDKLLVSLVYSYTAAAALLLLTTEFFVACLLPAACKHVFLPAASPRCPSVTVPPLITQQEEGAAAA